MLKVEWVDLLEDYLRDLGFAPVPDAGHVVHRKRPELADREIAVFFAAPQ